MRNQTLPLLYLPAVLMAASAAQAAALPDGPGKAETTRVCGKCHSLEQATSLRQGQSAWKETISKMVNLGAEGSDAEFTAIQSYLVKNFGAANGGATTSTAPAATTAPAAESPAANATEG